MKKLIIYLLSVLFLFGCTSAGNNKPVPPSDIDKDPEITLLQFFPQSPTERLFLGKGNEFATYTETFYKNEGSYYPSIVENGGTSMLRIYKVTEDEIALVYEEGEFYDDVPPISSLEDKFQTRPILTAPIKVGSENREWKVIEYLESLKVPFGNIPDVYVLEKKNKEGSTEKQYWARQYGKIKEEFIIDDQNGVQFEVTSELEKIND
jgi:hypothetical protein